MSNKNYPGIDYGGGQSNIDRKTGIRYGVIGQNSISPEAMDDFEPDYGKPSCPKCGKPAATCDDFDYTAECGVYQCDHCQKVWYPMELDDDGQCPDCQGVCRLADFTVGRGSQDHACHSCHYVFDSQEAYPDEPLGWNYEDDRYSLSLDSSGDVWVLKSPYFTHAQFCSPCAPGAGHLDNPCPDGPKTYCLGHGWFDDGVAPYPVYSVETEEEVKPE